MTRSICQPNVFRDYDLVQQTGRKLEQFLGDGWGLEAP